MTVYRIVYMMKVTLLMVLPMKKIPHHGNVHTIEWVKTDPEYRECYEKSGACLLNLFPPHSAED